MSAYMPLSLTELLLNNPYPGRGIVIGTTPDGRCAVSAYMIMGRSENSRNRIFVEQDGVVRTEPFVPSRLEDPSLIIYPAVRPWQNRLIVTNGDQTDTVLSGLKRGQSLEEALRVRSFEPDAPNFTPRISGLLTFADGSFSYEMSILKSGDEAGTACARYHFAYPPIPGTGHFLHTYQGDGSPLPAFSGEPERVQMEDDLDRFTDAVWNALNADNRISLYVRYTDLEGGAYRSRLINRHQ